VDRLLRDDLLVHRLEGQVTGRFGRFMRRHGWKVWALLGLALWLLAAASFVAENSLAGLGWLGLSLLCAGAGTAAASIETRKKSR
jgi:hypothetical protein